MPPTDPFAPRWTRAELDAYLQARYVTLDRLAAETGFAAEALERLAEAGCVPGPSYELRLREELCAHVNGEADTLSTRTVEKHFARDVVAWIASNAARLRAGDADGLAPVLDSELRAAFREGLALHGAADIRYEGFVAPDGRIDEAGFDAHFEGYVRPHWRRGTWGICVYDSQDMRNVARKTVAVKRLELLTEGGRKTRYSPAEARRARDAMVEYDAIVPPFSPHDRHVGSRARLVEAIGPKVGYDPGAPDRRR